MTSLPARSPTDRRFKSSLRKNVVIGFVAAIVAVFAIAALSFRALDERTEDARRVTSTLVVSKLLETLGSRLKDAETGQRGYLLTGEEEYLEPYASARATIPRTIAEARVALGDEPAQVARLETVERLSNEKLAEQKETIDLRRADRTAAALSLVNSGRGKQAMDRIQSLISEMSAAEAQRLAVRSREFERSQWWSATVTSAGSAVLFLLIVAAWFMASRDSRVQQIEAWIQTGQSELSRNLVGDQTTAALGDAVVSFIARYLGAEIAAVYVQDRGRKLQLAGAWGVSEDAIAARASTGASGLGLSEQVLKDGRAVHVRDVPEDYFSVSSGLGSQRPRHLIVTPTRTDIRTNGMLELGFFREPAAYELELLSRIAEPVGIAFRSARYRTELQDLLEETQRQAEELQTQQEELKTSNEELEQQSSALLLSHTQMQNQQAELEQINSHLEEQTQSLERQRDELARVQTELQRSSGYKSEFLANMSHELRTPLNSSLILAKLLLDNREGNLTTDQVKFAQTIYSAGNDLLTLINDILDLSKIEAGKLEVRPETVSVAHVVDDMRNTFAPIAKDKQLELTAEVADGVTSIYTDNTRLQQVLRNLLSNALKFTERGVVALNIRSIPEARIAFSVKDTGIGIAATQHEVVFEAFRQADGTTNRKYGGTGLGLSISRDLARLLGGELTLESAPGQGSTFTLILPEHYVAQASPAALPAPPAAAPALAASSPPAPTRAAVVPTTGALPTPAPGSTSQDDRDRIAYGKRAILVIEDDPAFARIVQDLAHELDFQALVASSAEEGLAMAERYRPSAIVLDVGLPDRSGLSVLDVLKRNPNTRHMPVHIVSASDHRQAAFEMGATGYAVKPVAREQLASALKQLETKFSQKLRRVLVVEDNDAHREATCRLLSLDNVETVPATTTGAALELLKANTFDCMVLDLALPDRSGFDLLEEMSRKEQYSFPPVIVYTGRSLSRDEEQRLRRFSNSIIVKGARSPERLLDEVTLFLHQVESELPPDRQRMLRDARHREAVFDGRRVLIVEDDIRNVFALTSVLEPKGVKVEVARNGREALTHLEAKPGVDLVLMDIMMPEMDGLEAMRHIRAQPENARLPIIALTAKAMTDDRENCLIAGANDYIAKPLDVDKLLSLVRVWMPK